MLASRAPHTPPAARLRRWRTVLSLLLLGGAAACGGGGGDTPTPPQPTPGSLAISLASFPASVAAGGQATAGVTITRGGSFTGAVTLSTEGVPSGVTASLSATSLATGVSTATLTVQVGAGVAAGNYPITVRASGSGVTSATAQLTLVVTASSTPSFTLTASSTAVSVVAGQQGTSTLTIARSGGFTGTVNLVAEGAPTGVTASLAPAAVTGTSSTLTLAVGASTAVGTYPITVRATGAGVAQQTASITLTVTEPPRVTLTSSAAAVSIVQGQQSAPITITIARTAVTGPANFTVTGSPTGITATLSPNPATGTTSALTLAVAPTVAPGQYPVSLQAVVGSSVGSLSVQVTVTSATTPDYGLSLSQSALTVTAGQSTSTTVNIARSGGFLGAVTFGTSALPAGTTVTFTPASATGATALLSITTTAGTPAGTYAIILFGNATGLAQRQVTLTLTVQGGGGGSGNVVYRFCDTDRFPIWFAYRDGTTGAWTRVLPGANQTYTFTLNQNLGGVTYVFGGGGTDFEVTTFYLSRTEHTAFGADECDNNPGRKTLTGTVAGLGAGQSARISIGAGSGAAGVNGPFTVTNVNDGLTDLLAARTTIDLLTFSTTPDRFILRRNLNLPNNGAIPALDFGGAEAFAPATATYTIGNVAGDSLNVTSGFTTANGAAGFFTFGPPFSGAETRTIYGIPNALTQTGDLHYVLANAITGTDVIRQVAGYNRELTNRTLTLGPVLNAPTVTTVASAPYRRARATGTWQTEYNQGVGVSFTQTTGGGRSWSVSVTSGYSGGATYDLEVPDLSTAAGFNTTWGLQVGAATDWALSASRVDNAPLAAPVENFRFFAASRLGVLP